jgi:hypothetical protein
MGPEMSLTHGFYRRALSGPTSREEIEAKSRIAWREQGVALLNPDDDRLPWDVRETIRQAAEKLYGPRERTRA